MLPHSLNGLFAEAKDTARIAHQAFACDAEIDAIRRARKELEAKLIFQAFDLGADGRLCSVERSGCSSERTMFRDRKEGPEQIRIELQFTHVIP
jgi:hypothetical protein